MTPADLPKAKLTERKGISVTWVVPLIAAAVAGWLVYKNVIQGGPTITILFTDGKGLQASQTVIRYRGVRVGDVRALRLTEDQRHVEVKARLDKSAASLAREGSQFWVVRPEISVGMVRGLETIVPGPHIQVQAGSGKEQRKFMGLDKAPTAAREEGGIDLVLLAPELGSLIAGAPVSYRGMEVGSVQDCVLGEDARTVNIQIHIGRRFAPLVREGTKFWSVGGINLDLSLFGAKLKAPTLKSLAIGAVAFATPDPPGPPAVKGMVFRLYDKPKDEWLAWLPEISLRTDDK
jgi:paraquat-inducible protein B